MKILVVADDDSMLRTLEQTLVLAGHEIGIVRNSVDAWEIVRSTSCQLTIVDWKIHGMDGVDLCRKIREAPWLNDVYTILLTDGGGEIDVVEGMLAGADDILAKPFGPAALRVRIHNAERVLKSAECNAKGCDLDTSDVRLRNVFAKTKDAILVIDGVADCILEANPAACQMFGSSLNDLLSSRASELHGQCEGNLRTMLYNNLSMGGGVMVELQFRTKAGNFFPAEVSASIVDLDGTLCILALIRDITHRRHSEQLLIAHTEALEQGNKVLRKSKLVLEKKNLRLSNLYKMAQIFVDNVSHEFRTPLTVIKEYADLLSEGAAGTVSPDQQHFLGVIADRADDLNTMVDDMLDSSKLDSGMLGIVRKPHKVSEIMNHVCPVLERKALNGGVGLHIDIGQFLPDVYVDHEKVGRILINLVGNAIRFAGEPGSVRIWARAVLENRGVTVGITDNGPEIAMEHQQEIFNRFQQLGGQVRGSCKGFGLGLSIARELVDLNLGELSLESQPGMGTTLQFTLPAYDPAEVLARYLARLERLNKRANMSPIIMLSASIAEFIPNTLTEEVNFFLEHLLRGSDLVFRSGTHRWVILLPVGRLECQEFLLKVERAWQDTNRNRPHVALPAVEFTIVECWSMDAQKDILRALLDQLKEIVPTSHPLAIA